MSHSIFSLLRKNRAGCWCGAAVLLMCLASAGCTGLNPCGGGSREHGLSGWTEQFGADEHQDDTFVLSNEGRKINDSLCCERRNSLLSPATGGL